VHPDAVQAADVKLTLDPGNGYKPAPRHEGLYEGTIFPPRPNVIPMAEVVKDKPVWREAFEIKSTETSQALLESVKSGDQEEMRLRARMMASVDEGVGQLFDALEKSGQLDDTFILFLGDNGYFFGEHGLGLERRFAYEEGIRSPFIFRYPRRVKPGTKIDDLVLALDIAPTCIELAGGTPGPQVQGRSLLPLMEGRPRGTTPGWRDSILCEYFSENAMPWLIGMSYKAVRTDRYKLIHWVNRGDDGELDELYDLDRDPYEMNNLIDDPACAEVRRTLRVELGRLVATSVGL
jgi:N-acetylglucosamine-6-sulfatase